MKGRRRAHAGQQSCEIARVGKSRGDGHIRGVVKERRMLQCCLLCSSSLSDSPLLWSTSLHDELKVDEQNGDRKWKESAYSRRSWKGTRHARESHMTLFSWAPLLEH